MRTPAAIYVEAGKPMVIDDIDLPDPGPTHVVVKQYATGVCHSQLHELDRPNAAVPLVLGHEATGVVTAVGSDVTHVGEGENVMVTWVPRGASPNVPPRRRPPSPTAGRLSTLGPRWPPECSRGRSRSRWTSRWW